MKILHLTKKYPDAIGGDATSVFNLEKQQKNLSYDVTVITSNCNLIIKKSNIYKFGLNVNPEEIDFINLKRLISLIMLFFYSFYILIKLKPNIVHSHSLDMGFIFSLASRIFKIPLVQTCHGIYFPYSNIDKFRRFIEVFILKNSKFSSVIAIDSFALKALKNIGINAIYIPNGVDLNRLNSKGQNKDKISLLFVGRLESNKGLINLLESCKALKDLKIEFNLNIIGEGSLKNELVEYVKMNDLGNSIFFRGGLAKKDTNRYYLEADLFILPSLWEGFPIVILEAWANKLPVIVTNVGGISSICINKVNSVIIEPNNIRNLTESIIHLSKDEKFRKQLGDNGYELVKTKYTWEIINSQILKVYTNKN